MKSFVSVIIAACAAMCLPGNLAAQTRTLRIVTYNIEADTGGYATNRPGLVNPIGGGSVANGGVLEGIGEQVLGTDPAQPLDILALQETTSNTTTVSPIVNALNTYYNAPGKYAMSPYQATSSGGVTGGGGPNALIYNTTTVQLLASVPVDPPGGTSQLGSASGEYREVMRYLFAPAGVATNSAKIFYIYVSHYKASTGSANEAARAKEAQIIRANSATLPANSRILYVGDYNPTAGSVEQGYQTIISPGINQGIDPMNPSGATNLDWSGNSLMNQKTESASNLRYRDDFQIMTTNVYYGLPGGLALVSGTYHVFGNNGATSYGGSVSNANTALTNLAAGAPISASILYQDLTTASDHLPVVADYTVPLGVAPPIAGFNAGPANGAAPLSVSFTNLSSGATNFWWNFGDGNVSAATNVSHVYAGSGTFSITLTAVGAGGTNTFTRAGYIVVAPPSPLSLVNCSFPAGNAFHFAVTNLDGTPVTDAQRSRIAIYTAATPNLANSNWTVLSNATSLVNGLLEIYDTNTALYPQRFYRAVETP